MRTRSGIGIVATLAFTLACSSVPDVEYLDAATGASSNGSSGTPGDAGQPGDSGPPGEDEDDGEYRCPDKPPPAERGLCCGAFLCLGCTTSHCVKCERAKCHRDEECCARTPVNVDCRKPDTCG